MRGGRVVMLHCAVRIRAVLDSLVPWHVIHCDPLQVRQMNTISSLRLWVCVMVLWSWGATAEWVRAAPAEATARSPVIQEINIVHFSHTDVGFTDSPSVCRELYRRYLDIAVDTALDTTSAADSPHFCWTAEATMPVNDWWQVASAERREQFLQAVRAGQLDVTALPFNNTPFMNAAQWQTMLHWLPDDLWQQVQPRVAMQNDVNGLPRAAAMALLDRGVRYLFTGINEDSGGVPFPRPAAFWWKMPDGRRMFVWLNIGYGSGFDFFESQEWRRGPVPLAADTRYRPPRAGDILASDEAAVRQAHRRCVERIGQLEESGYKQNVLAISITSQWRFDNDPPFPPLTEFVAAWNRLELQPRLRLVTVTQAMERLEKAWGSTAPEYSGEWTDWWANGTASAPRVVAASRAAKRSLAATQSPLWGPTDPRTHQTIDQLYRDLCLFDEHTWGSSLSVAKPYSLDTQGQFTEKSLLAYRPMAQAEWLLSQRVRTRLADEGEGLFVINATSTPYSGWVRLIASCLRDDYRSLQDPQTGARYKLDFGPGVQPWGRPGGPEDLTREDVSATFPDNAPNRTARFWVEHLAGPAVMRLQLSRDDVRADPAASEPGTPEIKTDAGGWPTAAVWTGMAQPLFLAGAGDFVAVQVHGFAPRHILADIRSQHGDARQGMRAEHLEEVAATAAEQATLQETDHTLCYSQAIQHPRMQWGTRTLEIWKRQPRARFTLRLNRLSSAAPEILYVNFPLPTGAALPRVSSGGLPFTPFSDQLPGTCRDYFAIDGWADYDTADGNWLWVSRDAPLITFGTAPTLARRNAPPDDVHLLRAMVFNNFWYTNFVADEHGIMEFQFDLLWQPKTASPVADLAETLVTEPLVLINPDRAEDPRVLKHLFGP